MKVRDKNVKQMVDVSDKECPTRECYWPRPDPGIFTQGVGYRTRYPGRKPDWLCGNREIRGCPDVEKFVWMLEEGKHSYLPRIHNFKHIWDSKSRTICPGISYYVKR